MPYAKWSDVNPAIKGIEPRITLAQANTIASWADNIENVDSPWAVAISQFKKLYTVRDGKWVKEAEVETEVDYETTMTEDMEEAKMKIAEYIGGLSDLMSRIQGAFRKVFQPPSAEMAEPYLWVRDVFVDHPELGNAVIVEDQGILWSVGYDVTEEGSITFNARTDWVQVIPTYVKVPSREVEAMEFAESAVGHAISLAERSGNEVVPLHLDIAIIEPGFGNKKDNHYYSREVLERDAGVFEGVKMYESDHRPGEKSTRTWVSTVTGIEGFTDDGAPIGRVSVHEKSFAERLLALDADGLLGKMECSILASGQAKKGKIDGKKAKIVEAITSAESVDWVTRAGCGGRALAITESAQDDYQDIIERAYHRYEL